MIDHHCNWPGCSKRVTGNWACRDHWFALPPRFRSAITRTYEAGRDMESNPTPEYIGASEAAKNFVRGIEGKFKLS